SGAVRRSGRARSRTRTAGAAADRARGQLRSFRKASVLAVAMTGFLLLIVAPDDPGAAQQPPAADTAAGTAGLPDTVAIVQQVPLDSLQRPAEDTSEVRADSLSREGTREATRTLRDLWISAIALLPKLGIALGIFLVAWLLVRVLRPLLRRTLGRWERADAFTALSAIAIWLLALGIALSVLAGDFRALLGSLGLIGLALSWALQTPIESFTGWLLNSFRGYYRVGDRISVGEVFGDVYRIDLLTTTVWEYGGADRAPGTIRAEQPTGRLITFPNNEVLTGTVVNYTRDFPFVWDELEVAVANESEMRYALETLRRVAHETVAEQMREPAKLYRGILKDARLEMNVPEEPQVFVAMAESSAVLTIRYLVGAREKRRWKSELSLRVLEELNRPEHQGRILPVYPRRQVQIVGPDGAPSPDGWTLPEGEREA
ncbi:MAG TPA: mechanosensitive ion channel domain-containing protein, partial [Longimicrobiaceae bacterium]|nr:mechanosensitive ion channel domain-containing protein [Longimicrobiaceae bacterium]